MKPTSIPTRGRTLDHAALVYDYCEPILFLGRLSEYDAKIISILELAGAEKILDLDCGTGRLTRMIADQLDPETGGVAVGIDAAACMIRVAQKNGKAEPAA